MEIFEIHALNRGILQSINSMEHRGENIGAIEFVWDTIHWLGGRLL